MLYPESQGVIRPFQTDSKPVPPPEPPRYGVKAFYLSNCDSEGHAVRVWIQDATTGGDWVDKGNLNAAPLGACRAAGTEFFTFIPVNGHHYRVAGTDLLMDSTCTVHDPNYGQCLAFNVIEFDGNVNGYIRHDAIDSNTQVYLANPQVPAPNEPAPDDSPADPICKKKPWTPGCVIAGEE